MAKLDKKIAKEIAIVILGLFIVLGLLAARDAFTAFSIKNVGSAPYRVYQGDLLLGEHHTQHKAEERAVNAALKCKCLIEIKRDRVIEVEYTPDEETPEEPVEETTQHVISWDRPTAREDGTTLSEDEIGGYEVKRSVLVGEDYVEHEIVDVGNVVLVSFIVPKGVYKYEILTYDTQITKSVYSNPIFLE